MKRLLEVGLWLCVLALGFSFALEKQRVGFPAQEGLSNITLPSQQSSLESDSVLAAMGELVVTRDLFRLERRPTRVEFGSLPQTATAVAPIQRPDVNLSGVAGGPPWLGVFDGIPGRDPPLVAREGDDVVGYHVVRVEPRRAVLRGYDTTITLLLRRIGQ